MSTIKFNLNFRPLTYNQYYRSTKSGKRVKTGAGLAYDELLGEIFEDYSSELLEFGRKIDPAKHYVKLSLLHFNSKFYIKDKSRLNQKSGDNDGSIKILQDKIFTLMKFDDYIIKHHTLMQLPGDIDKVMLEISIEDITSLHAYPNAPMQ